MVIIVAADQNWAIGNEGGMLYHLPPDLQHFREKTEGKVVVMGHGTLKSLPGSIPLANRTNIILSRKGGIDIKGGIVCGSKEGLFELIKPYKPNDVFVIGGQAVYELLLDYCTRAIITKIQATAKAADTFFPNLDERNMWKLEEMSEVKTYGCIRYSFNSYSNCAVNRLGKYLLV